MGECSGFLRRLADEIDNGIKGNNNFDLNIKIPNLETFESTLNEIENEMKSQNSTNNQCQNIDIKNISEIIETQFTMVCCLLYIYLFLKLMHKNINM